MSLRRLRAGEWLAVAGAVALPALLSTDWFGAEGARAAAGVDRTGLAALGWPLVAWLALTEAGVAWTVVATAASAPVSHVMVATVLTVTAALVAFVAVVVRVAVAQPGLGAGLSDERVAVEPAAVLGVLATGAILAGIWRAMADERTTAAESAVVAPPPRPAPPAEP